MFSGRRKSSTVVYHEGIDPQNPAPRRLVKPRINKSTNNLRLQALQQLEGKIKSNSTSDLPLSLRPGQSRARIKTHIFENQSEQGTQSLSEEPSEWKGVASLVKSIEARQSVEVLPLNPPKKPRRPFSSIFGSRRPSSTSVQTTSSNNSRVSLPLGTPTSSNGGENNHEETLDLTPTRLQRRSSYTPGVATRQEKPEKEPPIPQFLARLEEANDETADFSRPSMDDWVPPPRIERAETPSDLESPQLGGLQLGSLQITNGRASPAPSELSRRLFPRVPLQSKRDTSSDYGDIEVLVTTVATTASVAALDTAAEYQSILDPPTPTLTQAANADADDLTPAKVLTPTPTKIRRKPVAQSDQTSAIAKEYIAEMPDSPYTPTTTVPETAQDVSPCTRASSTTGSVIITSKANEFDDQLFEDEGVASIHSGVDRLSMDSFYSVTDKGSIQDERFSSTVEFQRIASPEKPQMHELAVPENHDSGYSSNASTRDDASEIVNIGTEKSPPTRSSNQEAHEHFIGASRLRAARPVSILKQTRATAPELSTFANIRPTMSSTTSMTSLNTQSDVQPHRASMTPKKSRKLQKRRPLSQPTPIELIAVQGAHLDIDAVPPIPPEFSYNLEIRAKEVPELEKTFKTMDHTKRQSMSSFSSNMPEIRFPSPSPESEDVRSQQRVSVGRRISFLGKFKGHRKSSEQQTPEELSRYEAFEMLDGYASSSPYDAVRPESSREKGARRPKLVRPHSMMDDETAAQFARLRSQAAAEREYQNNMNIRRSSINDRGRPGVAFVFTATPYDAPPLPPLPPSNGVNTGPPRRMTYQDHFQSQHHAQYTTSLCDEPDNLQADNSNHSYSSDLLDFVPPPPSHSPQPVITSSAESHASWRPEGPMNLTRNRLPRSSWQPPVRAQIDEPLYPEIPPRSGKKNEGSYTRFRDHRVSENSDCARSARRTLPVPSGTSYWASQTERPRSRNSQISYAGSLAESLHPTELERVTPPPVFGRYSGGMSFDYEKGVGFGGSAGTRSFSGKAEARRKGVALRASHGVDLGDIPIMA